MPRLPFSVFPDKVALGAAKPLTPLGDFVSAFFPFLSIVLPQAEYDYAPRDYSAVSLAVALLNALFFLGIIMAVAVFTGNRQLVGFGVAIAIAIWALSFITATYYPYIIASRRKRAIEAHLIPALQQLLIELKSGVTLFNSMVSVSSDYGAASTEIKKIIYRINAGISELDAIAEVTATTPSDQFRKVLWQISNSLKVGSDISTVLESQLVDLMRERIDQIRSYGQELSPWTMIYMLAAVVLPSLGVTMLIVIIGFLGTPLPDFFLALFIIVLVFFQLFFLNFIASRRPAI